MITTNTNKQKIDINNDFVLEDENNNYYDVYSIKKDIYKEYEELRRKETLFYGQNPIESI